MTSVTLAIGLARPFEVRFPNGAAQRDAGSCFGISIDENDMYKRRDEILARLEVQHGEHKRD